MLTLKSERELIIMRDAANILKDVMVRLKDFIAPGISTSKLDVEARKLIEKFGADPAFLGYYGFPATICTSINDEVVHGIPSDRVLADGDIISVDVGVKYKGYFSDAARTYPVGKITKNLQDLIRVTRNSLFEGLKAVKPDARLGDLSNRIQTYIEDFGYGVVRDFVGHGIGTALHEDPQVPNYGKAGQGIKMQEGLAIAIEPMVNLGKPDVKILDDGWTVVTADGQHSAHHEETVLITKNGPEVITKFEEE